MRSLFFRESSLQEQGSPSIKQHNAILFGGQKREKKRKIGGSIRCIVIGSDLQNEPPVTGNSPTRQKNRIKRIEKPGGSYQLAVTAYELGDYPL